MKRLIRSFSATTLMAGIAMISSLPLKQRSPCLIERFMWARL